jgi:hypothetical protein
MDITIGKVRQLLGTEVDGFWEVDEEEVGGEVRSGCEEGSRRDA